MTSDDDTSESLVDDLFREVDSHFSDLEQQYAAARNELQQHDRDRRDGSIDHVASTSERFELMSENASLRAELSRTVEAVDERDRILHELSERMSEFEAQIVAGEQAVDEARELRQAVVEERREVSRLNALLDARLAERQELTDLAHRLQAEKEHVEELLATALGRFEQVDTLRAELADKLGALEAARNSEAHEYESRATQLAEAKADVKQMSDQVEELIKARDDAEQRANKSEGLVERRSNEVSYLNRRIEALTVDAEQAGALDDQITELRKENTLLQRRLDEATAESESRLAEAAASARAVEALAARSSERDEYAAKVAELELELDRSATTALVAEVDASSATSKTSAEIQRLTNRIRNLESPGGDSPVTAPPAGPADFSRAVSLGGDDSTVDDADDAEADVASAYATRDEPATAAPDVTAATEAPATTEVPAPAPAAAYEPPRFDLGGPAASTASPRFDLSQPAEAVVVAEELQEPDASADPFASEIAAASRADTSVPSFSLPSLAAAPPAGAAIFDAPSSSLFSTRSRSALPDGVEPNTAEALSHLLGQPGVVVLVDARSSCSHSGMRPTELFNRVGVMRDRFDVPVDIVVTPVSTPVGGAPDMSAVGIHEVTGAETVADRVRSLCLGYPSDQPLVVIAADDHVRQAALSEEANVVGPDALLHLVNG